MLILKIPTPSLCLLPFIKRFFQIPWSWFEVVFLFRPRYSGVTSLTALRCLQNNFVIIGQLQTGPGTDFGPLTILVRALAALTQNLRIIHTLNCRPVDD